jgi:hypothetical protein
MIYFYNIFNNRTQTTSYKRSLEEIGGNRRKLEEIGGKIGGNWRKLEGFRSHI